MTTEENKTQISPEQLQIIRQSLIETIFKSYHELIKKLQQLPINQVLPIIQKAYLEIDCSMLVFKEILIATPLSFTAVPPKKNQEKKEEAQEIQEESKEKEQAESQMNSPEEKNIENDKSS